ncbi:MAG: CinA family protein [Chloroflexi bacterium]|nr:CinA family protein [Chloroflexota bacterium]
MSSVPPQEAIGPRLRRLGMTLATAESCTGGLVAHLITTVPGSSDYFVGSVVSYSNSVKHSLLGVPNEILERYGAVSEECALDMAAGVRRLLGTDIAVSTTGIAGPGGETPGKPVGLVFIALSDRHGQRCEKYLWHGDRLENIRSSAHQALKMLRAYLEE